MQKEVLNNIKEAKQFNVIRQDKQKHESMSHKRQKLIENCKYCSTEHPQRQFPAYGKICSGGGKLCSMQVNAEAVAWPEVTEEGHSSVHMIQQDVDPYPLE